MIKTYLHAKGITDLTPLNGFHNTIYEGTYKDTPIIIRISTRRTKKEIEEEIRVLDTIKDKVYVVEPIEIESDKVMELDGSVMAFFKKSEGLNWNETKLKDKEHFNAGKELGLLHKAFQELGEVDRPTYDKHPDIELIKDSTPFYQKHTKALLKTIASWEKSPKEYGLIHGDYLFGNLLFHEKGVTILDFDDIEYGYYLYDIAVYLFYLLLGGDPQGIHEEPNIEVFKNFMKGYRSVNEETVLDFDKLQTLFRLRQLKLLGTITKTIDPDTYGDWQKGYIKLANSQLKKDDPFVEIPYQSIYETLSKDKD